MQNFDWLSRSELLVGREGLEKLASKHVLIVGLGGVGSYAAEAIARAGIGKITIIDGDDVERSNINRQMVALNSTIDKFKADIMAERIRDINPEVELIVIKNFMGPDEMDELLTINTYDYVMDCIDSVMPKLTLISQAYRKNLPLISSMGAGGKVDPTKLQVADLGDSHTCKLAFYIRKRLKKFGIKKGFDVVFSTETVIKESLILTDGSNFKRSAYGTISYLPAVFGMTCASVVIRNLLELPIQKYKRDF